MPKPFKSEWATVKDGLLWVGSMGRPYVLPDGSVAHRNAEWVKTVDSNGRIENHNWRSVYEALRTAAGVSGAGYLWHEAVHWDDRGRRWVLLPRKRSQDMYEEVADETRGTNIVLVASEDFRDITVTPVGPLEAEYGFTTLRKVPGTADVFLAVKAKEVGTTVHSVRVLQRKRRRVARALCRLLPQKLTVFDLQGNIRLDQGWVDLGDDKFEGCEFIEPEEAE